MTRIIILGILIFSLLSCEKQENGIRYSQDSLNGIWQTDEKNSLNCNQQIEISDTAFYEIKICAGIPTRFKATEYSFNGIILKYHLYGLDHEYEVKELTDSTLILGYQDPIVYYRIK